jgi:hypothetical protein
VLYFPLAVFYFLSHCASLRFDAFFAAEPAPSPYAEVMAAAARFVSRHADGQTPIVLITSGGTLVNLEKRTVSCAVWTTASCLYYGGQHYSFCEWR